MNKRKLQEFATWAKINLEKQIEISLKKIGINSETDIKRSRVQGDITVIDGIETTFKKGFQSLREDIVNRIKSDGFSHTIEQFASTWFNRIIALRFMEVHNYLDHGFKLFPTEPNTLPEILSKLSLVSDDLKLDMVYCNQLLSSGNHNEELYRYVLFQQCNALAKPLPMLFSEGMSYLEYFIPAPLLFGDTIINKLIEINEEDFKEDVEILGWLYQFYIASKKDEVFASGERINKETLPAVTQLFTPEWIVKYLVENSVGKIWLDSYPLSTIGSELNFYADEAKQERDLEEKLKEIRYNNVNPEDIKIIEPCSGSGHILIYCFDLLYKMYIEKGYSIREIPQHIFKNNLVGLDIDQRATQLASFALVMKARSHDSKFFEENRYVRPKLYEIIDSKAILKSNYNGKKYLEIIKEYNSKQWIGENQLSDDEIKSIEYIIDLFNDAKVIGSLLKVKPAKYLTIRKKLKINERDNTQPDIFTSSFFNREFKELIEILRVAYFLSVKYDVMITNPPYLSENKMSLELKKYLCDEYWNYRHDTYTAFISLGTRLVKSNGFASLITQHYFMYLSSFKETRLNLNMDILSLLHLGPRTFEEISGEVVQSAAFVLRNSNLNIASKFINLLDYSNTFDKKNAFLDCDVRQNVTKVLKISELSNFKDGVFAYLASKKMIDMMNQSETINEFVVSKAGVVTGDDDYFIRYWHEVDPKDINFTPIDEELPKYALMSKGGSGALYYGNIDYVIKINELRDNSKVNKSVRRGDRKYYFKKGIAWSQMGGGLNKLFYSIENCICGTSSPTVYPKDYRHFNYLLGFLNSNISKHILKLMNPTTLSVLTSDITSIPLFINDTSEVDKLVEMNLDLARDYWKTQENSWGFDKHPMIDNGRIFDVYMKHKATTSRNILFFKENENRINEYFIKLYGLEGELNSDIDDSHNAINHVSRIEEIKILFSYLVGILVGRFSAPKELTVEHYSILPIYSDISIEDGLIHKITKLVEIIYGKNFYRENIDFIADSLGKKSNETSEEAINRYINDDFYSNHSRIYKNRPIYWMLSSGRKNGFKCLIYIHKYKNDTLAKINANYFQPATTILRTKISELNNLIAYAQEKDKVQLERKRFSLVEQFNEAIEYGQVLDYMANKYISIDLDDGVKVNYAKFQGIEITTSNGKVKKDLLVPIK